MGKRKNNWQRLWSRWGAAIAILMLLLVLSGQPHPVWGSDAVPPVPTALEASALDYDAALLELQTAFTFQGQPINPRAVAALIPWLSDELPGAIAVDIEGTTADTNQFHADVSVVDTEFVIATWEQFGEFRFVAYRHLGKLADGTHVLRTFINTGGNAVFPYLTLLSVDLDQEMWWDGELRSRLIMTRRGELILGVDYVGDITLEGQAITLTPAPTGEPSMTIEVEPR